MTEYTCFIFRKVSDHVEFILTDVEPGRFLVPIIDVDEDDTGAGKKFVEQMECLGLKIENPKKHVIPFGKDWEKQTACMLVRVTIFPLNFPSGLHVRGIKDVFDNIDSSQAIKFYKLIDKLQQYGFFEKMDLEFFQKLEELRGVK